MQAQQRFDEPCVPEVAVVALQGSMGGRNPKQAARMPSVGVHTPVEDRFGCGCKDRRVYWRHYFRCSSLAGHSRRAYHCTCPVDGACQASYLVLGCSY